MRRLEVPVGSRDAGLHRQVEAPDDLPGGEAVGHHGMLIRELRVEALLVRGKLPGAEGLVEPNPLTGPQGVDVGDGQLKRGARRLRRWPRAALSPREGADRADAGVVEPM